jgi:hypothetical protein
MTDSDPGVEILPDQRDIPGLGTVTLCSIAFGIVDAAHKLALGADKGEAPRIFTSLILAWMVEAPALTPAEAANLSAESTIALVDIAVDKCALREEYDAAPAHLAVPDRFYHASKVQQRVVAYEMLGHVTLMLSSYRARHVFVRCPNCGKDYAISDPDMGRLDLLECYRQRRGKQCLLRCDQILPQDVAERLRILRAPDEAPCTRSFSLHEGLVEYRAQAPLERFSPGPFTTVEEGLVHLSIGQSIEPDLQSNFSWIDHVELHPEQTASGLWVRVGWYRTGPTGNRFVILTSVDDKAAIGEPTTVGWRAVGFRKQPEDQQIEPWRRFLISSASVLLYEHDPSMSILESWIAFELFLERFIEDNWKDPHLEETLEYLRGITALSTVTSVRLVLHEALGVHFVNSEVWMDWEWARVFRNRVAHGSRLKDTTYGHGKNKKRIGVKFDSDMEIAAFCYSSVVRAIYFIRYWDVDSSSRDN